MSKTEALREALNAFEPEGYSPVDTQAEIARAIVSTLEITRERVAQKATNQWTREVFAALLDLAEADMGMEG